MLWVWPLSGCLRQGGHYIETKNRLPKVAVVEGQKTLKIRIDAQACGNPLDCRLCLERCPEKVFATYPRRQREPGVPAEDYVIFPMFTSLCTGCVECVSFCPQQAISVR
ncbi:ATP-binding protein [Chloroflexota bacterium]